MHAPQGIPPAMIFGAIPEAHVIRLGKATATGGTLCNLRQKQPLLPSQLSTFGLYGRNFGANGSHEKTSKRCHSPGACAATLQQKFPRGEHKENFPNRIGEWEDLIKVPAIVWDAAEKDPLELLRIFEFTPEMMELLSKKVCRSLPLGEKMSTSNLFEFTTSSAAYGLETMGDVLIAPSLNVSESAGTELFFPPNTLALVITQQEKTWLQNLHAAKANFLDGGAIGQEWLLTHQKQTKQFREGKGDENGMTESRYKQLEEDAGLLEQITLGRPDDELWLENLHAAKAHFLAGRAIGQLLCEQRLRSKQFMEGKGGHGMSAWRYKQLEDAGLLEQITPGR